MQVVTDSPSRERHGPAAVAIGEFDGVHNGHRAVLAELRRQAAAVGCATAVVVLDEPAGSGEDPGAAGSSLTGIDERLHMIEGLGVDLACLTRPLAGPGARGKLARRALYDRLLGRVMQTKLVVHGATGQGGTAGAAGPADPVAQAGAIVASVGAARGFGVVTVPLVLAPGQDGTPVCAHEICLAIARCELARAALMLGRYYGVRGQVVRGDGRGRHLGYPTANIAMTRDVALPADGVYAGTYERPDGSRHPVMIALGRRLTFYAAGGQRLLEAHLLDCDDSLYGEQATVRFVSRIRDQRRFESAEALARQIGRDAREVHSALASLGEREVIL